LKYGWFDLDLGGIFRDQLLFIGRFLGKGGFAKCYELINTKTLENWAAKIFTKKSLKKKRAKENLFNEIQIHKSLNHQNIVKFEHYFEDPENVFVMLELCSNQTLNDLVKKRG